jgi:hypothetical protein
VQSYRPIGDDSSLKLLVAKIDGQKIIFSEKWFHRILYPRENTEDWLWNQSK